MEEKKEVGPKSERAREREREGPPSRWNWIRSRKINRVGDEASLLLFYGSKKKTIRVKWDVFRRSTPDSESHYSREDKPPEKCRVSFAISGCRSTERNVFISKSNFRQRYHLSLNFFLPCKWHAKRERKTLAMPLSSNILFRNIHVSFEGVERFVARRAKENGKVLLVERIIQSVSEWRIHRVRLKVKRSPFDPNRGNYFISSRRYGIKLKRERVQ